MRHEKGVLFHTDAVQAAGHLHINVREQNIDMAAQPHIRPRELRALSMPVLVLAGTHDVILSAHTRRIARSIPGAKLLFLEGPHQLSVASPEDYNRAVLSFLASCEP